MVEGLLWSVDFLVYYVNILFDFDVGVVSVYKKNDKEKIK